MNYAEKFADDFTELDRRYRGVEIFVQQIAKGTARGLIVNGPAGVGKSYAIKQYLDKHCPTNYKIINSHVTILALYIALYHYRQRGRVLVLDDADSAYKAVDGLNLLKAAMDSQPVRQVHWQTSSSISVPNSFQFEGSVILISNVGFGSSERKQSVQSAHLDALKDRAYTLTVAPGGLESQFKQICYMVLTHNILRQHNFTADEIQMLLEYVDLNLQQLTTVSLRTIGKLADVYSFSSTDWRSVADQSLLRSPHNG